MLWWKRLSKYLLYQEPHPYKSLFESGAEDRAEKGVGNQQKNTDAAPEQSEREEIPGSEYAEQSKSERAENAKPRRNGSNVPNGRRSTRKRSRGSTVMQDKPAGRVSENQDIDAIIHEKVELVYDLEQNRQTLAKIFRVPRNKDVVFRSLTIGIDPPVKALLVFIDGITNSQVQNMAILQPLMLLSGIFVHGTGGETGPRVDTFFKDTFDRAKEALVPNNQVTVTHTYARVAEDVLGGNSALLIDGYNQALLLETKGWQYRSVTTPQVEAVIRGPQEAFTEQIRVNTSLVRKIIHRPSLITEFIKVGNSAPMQCAIMYLDDLANPDLVREVKHRLESVSGDFMHETGLLEQMIEDTPWLLVPQILTTERPDRVAASLLEGQVAILVDGNPFVMVVPCTFFALMQAPEDAYIRWPLGSFVRIIRYLGLFLTLLLPAHYVAIIAYHQEFIPTDLLLAITGSREKVPFPSIVEVLIMELSFELIREAGIRIPGTVGTTLGIVGALILGQAAVAANIVSPILIIVVAVTALGSFAIPNYSFSLTVRVLRFYYIILGSFLGLLGIMVGFFIHLGVTATLKSFGVPFWAPVAPVTRKGNDYFLRGPQWRQKSRPDYLEPLQIQRQPKKSRGWRYDKEPWGGAGAN
ncbi:spore germination protein [Desulfallas thermosapovorans]|uniref:Spore germination protein KA n=1 Tax=Desulfallas thermosapovorans DSM 6562 TaxID=1121431 RepID=A0A5S4ZPH9_9FIRM|nr:spore germination protein [Desulfallas thermosapovorans]TYO94708.1 spore germination protein KA [Desulfallas thermosapovorans DSM 6562]